MVFPDLSTKVTCLVICLLFCCCCFKIGKKVRVTREQRRRSFSSFFLLAKSVGRQTALCTRKNNCGKHWYFLKCPCTKQEINEHSLQKCLLGFWEVIHDIQLQLEWMAVTRSGFWVWRSLTYSHGFVLSYWINCFTKGTSVLFAPIGNLTFRFFARLLFFHKEYDMYICDLQSYWFVLWLSLEFGFKHFVWAARPVGFTTKSKFSAKRHLYEYKAVSLLGFTFFKNPFMENNHTRVQYRVQRKKTWLCQMYSQLCNKRKMLKNSEMQSDVFCVLLQNVWKTQLNCLG